MAIILRRSSRIIVEGKQTDMQLFFCSQARAYGTKIVAYVSEEKTEEALDGIPMYCRIKQAQFVSKADVCIINSEGLKAADVIVEAFLAQIPLVLCMSSNVDAYSMAEAVRSVSPYSSSQLIGPTVFSIASPQESYFGTIAPHTCLLGSIGILGSEKSLTAVVVDMLTNRNFGQSTIVGLRKKPFFGLGREKLIEMFYGDLQTQKILYIPSVDDEDRDEVLMFHKTGGKKPMIVYVPGFQDVPPPTSFLIYAKTLEEICIALRG